MRINMLTGNYIKVAVSRDFRPQLFSQIEPSWAPDKQAQMGLLENSFSRRYSNLKLEKFDSAQSYTARNRNLLTS